VAAERCDLVVVGAGIHGAGVAQAAAAHGHSVRVLEQGTIACGTSSRSSKLIHGGLRYLEGGRFALVRECLHERSLLLRLAPDLVHLQSFHVPIYRETRRRPWQLHLGLGLYAVLGGLHRENRYRLVPRAAWDALDGLITDSLQCVFRYQDAQTDDAALTRAVIRSALALGADLKMPATLTRAELTEDGVVVHYSEGTQEHSVHTNILVNAAGPWVNRVLACVTPAVAPRAIDLVQGAHVIVPGELVQGCYYMEAPSDGRAVFALPWVEHTLVGTTESRFPGDDPAEVAPLPEEVDYLLDTLGHYFPARRGLTRDDLVGSFAGLRVLPGDGGAAFSRPRDTILHTDRDTQPRVLSIYGGKLTAYRATAEKVMHLLAPHLPARTARADTRTLRLSPE
jgi:glycerol-3-phosphate dehydrogenase